MKTKEAIELASKALDLYVGDSANKHAEAKARLEQIITKEFPYIDIGGRDIAPLGEDETETGEPTLDKYVDAALDDGPCG